MLLLSRAKQNRYPSLPMQLYRVRKKKGLMHKKKKTSATAVLLLLLESFHETLGDTKNKSLAICATLHALMRLPTSALYPLYFLMMDDTVWMMRGWFALLPTKRVGERKKNKDGACDTDRLSLNTETRRLIDFCFHFGFVSVSCSASSLARFLKLHQPQKCSHMLRLILICSWLGFQQSNCTVVMAGRDIGRERRGIKNNFAQNLNCGSKETFNFANSEV